MLIQKNYQIDFTDPYHVDDYGHDLAFLDESPMYWDNDIPSPAPVAPAGTQVITSLPGLDTRALTDSIPNQDTWTLRIYRTEYCWAFDMPDYGVKCEALMCGTERVLEHWYAERFGLLPSKGDQMDMIITRSGGTSDIADHEYYDTKLVWLREDDDLADSNYYLDVHTLKEVWLCPFLKVLWKSVPELIYVSFEDVNKPMGL